MWSQEFNNVNSHAIPGKRPTTTSRPEWQSGRFALPSGLLSVIAHLLFLLALSWYLQNWQRPPAGFGDEPTRTVGIRAVAPGEVQLTEPQQPNPSNPDSSPEAATDLDLQQLTATLPPAFEETSTSSENAPPNPPIIGAGTPASVATTAGSTTSPNPSRITQRSGQAAGQPAVTGIPGTAFMGIKDHATRVVFVIDCSGSMLFHNAMRVAKSELAGSLQSLDAGQQFQVLFYNEFITYLKLKNEAQPRLYFATEINRTLAKQQISGIQPDHGTQHLPAIKMALKLGPEVIYLLTDADEPELSSAERKEIDKLNQGRTRIHCIEFGKGSELNGVDNFLKKLARENEGSYRYVDVTRVPRNFNDKPTP